MPHAPIFASKQFQGSSDGGRYGDVIEEIDWSVGRVMAAIKLAKLDTNTLVIFTSDNGPWSMFGPHGGAAGPLRGEKGTSWEGGYRVRSIFHWPGKIKPATVPDMAANLDLYATFATLTGGQQPQELPGYRSLDLTETLLQGKPTSREHTGSFRVARKHFDLGIIKSTSAPRIVPIQTHANVNPPSSTRPVSSTLAVIWANALICPPAIRRSSG